MSYNTKYILSYCNRFGKSLRIELQVRDYVGEQFILVNEDQYLQNDEGQYVVNNIDGDYDPNRDKNSVEGGANPFTLTYQNDLGEKGGTIRATYADMEFYEDMVFNIDDLATSDETEIRAVFYYDDVIEWIGFVTPDFFNVEITENPLIRLTASDRIGILKDVDYSYNELTDTVDVNFIKIISKILSNTGLNLNLNVSIGLVCQEWVEDGARTLNALHDTYVSERRFVNQNSVTSCYEALKAICNQFNCFFTQYNGEWWIVNKEDWELGLSTASKYNSDGELLNDFTVDRDEFHFGLIDSGGERTLIPASSVNTMILEYGDTQVYPKNYNFLDFGFPKIQFWEYRYADQFHFHATDRIPLEYYAGGQFSNTEYYSDGQEYLRVWNRNEWGVWLDLNEPHIRSTPFKVVAPNKLVSNIKIEIEAIMKPGTNIAFVVTLDTKRIGDPNRWVVLRDDTNGNYVWTTFEYRDGYPNQIRTPFTISSPGQTGAAALIPDVVSKTIETRVKKIDSIGNIEDMEIEVNVYGVSNVNGNDEAIVKFVKVTFENESEQPKGTVYQNKIEGNFTKRFEDRKILFGDYLDYGQNGFFYQYPKDSLSIQYASDGKRTLNWSTPFDTSAQTLAVHALRQQSRSYGRSHDELRIGFDMERINPFAHYAVRCRSEKRVLVNPEDDYLQEKNNKYITATIGKYLNSKRFVFVEGKIDYLRSHFEGVLAQIRTNEVQRQEYIYSYFEQGDIS